MNLTHDQRSEAHDQIIPLLGDSKIAEANAVARKFAGDDWKDLVFEAKTIYGWWD